MRLIDFENKIKDYIKEDNNDPEIISQDKRLFDTIWDLTYYYFRRYKIMNHESECYDVSYNIAVDLFMRISQGKEIYSWIGYICRIKMSYVGKYLKQNKPEIIDTTDNPELAEAVKSIFTGSCTASYNNDVRQVSSEIFINNIDKVIDKICNKTRYTNYSVNKLNLKISIALSMINDTITPYGLDEGESMYLRMVLPRVKSEFSKGLKIEFSIGEGANDSGLSELQLATLEGGCYNE